MKSKSTPSLGYVLLYVADVAASLKFWTSAFGLEQKFLHESGQYGELDTGGTTIGFCGDTIIQSQGIEYRPNRSGTAPSGFAVTLLTDEPDALFARALKAGATSVKRLEKKPWGQWSGFVADENGLLVEIATPIEPH